MRRKQKGAGCGCGGMEMLGFPKTGGFLSLFGGQEEAVGTPPVQDSSVVMKEASPQEIIGEPKRIKSSMESSQAMEPSRPKPRKPSMEFSEDSMSDEAPMKMRRSKRSTMYKKSMPSFEEAAPFIDREIKTMKQEINNLKNQVSELQSSSGSSTTTSRGLFGGRRKTLRRLRKHRR